MTAREAQLAARQRLAGGEDAARDAELLLLHVLQIGKPQLFANPNRVLSAEEIARYDTLIARRALHEPVQYILGKQEFYGLEFRVTPATLIPRPETELLVESVLQRVPANVPIAIADVGTGSGCIAVALAVHLPEARLTAIDLSADALAVARENAEFHKVADRIVFLQSDLLAGVTVDAFDAVVSNPPYVPESDRISLAPQVREFEPASALFAGEDGLSIYRRLIPQAASLLKPGGLLALEIGYGQSEAVPALLQDGWRDVTVLRDLQGIARTLLARIALSQILL